MKHDQELQQQADRDAIAEGGHSIERAASPASDVSSLEDDLLHYAAVQHKRRPSSLAPPANQGRKPSQSGRSETTSNSSASRRIKRTEEVPYDQRHKRKWEGYIQGEDPIEGSVTHRRLAREMDDQQTETVELDY